ncbi:MAG: hypothetical protein ACXWAW_19685, partial [Usitatibacter sp.]
FRKSRFAEGFTRALSSSTAALRLRSLDGLLREHPGQGFDELAGFDLERLIGPRAIVALRRPG